MKTILAELDALCGRLLDPSSGLDDAGWMDARQCHTLLVGCAPSRTGGAMKWRKTLKGRTLFIGASMGPYERLD